jgi:hypothetical protein
VKLISWLIVILKGQAWENILCFKKCIYYFLYHDESYFKLLLWAQWSTCFMPSKNTFVSVTLQTTMNWKSGKKSFLWNVFFEKICHPKKRGDETLNKENPVLICQACSEKQMYHLSWLVDRLWHNTWCVSERKSSSDYVWYHWGLWWHLVYIWWVRMSSVIQSILYLKWVVIMTLLFFLFWYGASFTQTASYRMAYQSNYYKWHPIEINRLVNVAWYSIVHVKIVSGCRGNISVFLLHCL